MDKLHITIQRDSDQLFLTEGIPEVLGITGASLYVAFIYTNVHVTVWITDELEGSERKRVNRALLNLIKHKTTVISDAPPSLEVHH